MATLDVTVPPKLNAMFSSARTAYRWRVLRGGRGSGKSFTVAKMAAIWGAVEKLRILCTREYQNSIRQSMHAELKNAIESEPWLAAQYDIGVDYLRHRSNGTEFIFAGLRANISSIKSMAQIDLCIVEEAEAVPHASWQDLVPTIRADGSGFIIIYNPRRRDSWVAQTFDTDTPPPRALIADINYDGNPWFPAPLDEQRLHDRNVLDHALYKHIWEGAYYEQSEAQIFSGKYRIAEFEPRQEWDGPYCGLDFGFANDETAATKSWVNGDTLYIEHELYQKHLETDHMAAELKRVIPDIEHLTIRADNARPETISYLKRHGLPKVVPCKKGKGSVEDGIEYIKSFREVVIHPRCKNTINEFDLYSYKIDRLSGDVLPGIIDSFNHAIDSLRYGLEPLMRRRQSKAKPLRI